MFLFLFACLPCFFAINSKMQEYKCRRADVAMVWQWHLHGNGVCVCVCPSVCDGLSSFFCLTAVIKTLGLQSAVDEQLVPVS